MLGFDVLPSTGDNVGTVLFDTDGVFVGDPMVGAVELVTFGGEVGDFDMNDGLSEDLIDP